MLEILKYITSSFWVFSGSLLILLLICLTLIKLTDSILSELNVALANFLEFLDNDK